MKDLLRAMISIERLQEKAATPFFSVLPTRSPDRAIFRGSLLTTRRSCRRRTT
jgi:hypothetical protein